MHPLESLIFTVVFVLETGALSVQYSVENRGTVEVFLVNMLTRYQEGVGWKPDPTMAYIYVRPNEEIEITKRVPPAPDGLVPAVRNYYVTPLRSGETFQEKLRFPLPLIEIHPYESIVGKPPPPITMTVPVRFVLGVFSAQPRLVAEPTTVLGVPTYQLKIPRPDLSSKGTSVVMPAEQYLQSPSQTLTVAVIPLATARQ